MSASLSPRQSLFVTSASINGLLIAEGYESPFSFSSGYSTLSVDFLCGVDPTLQIFTATTAQNTHRVLYFEKVLSANTRFFKKFQVNGIFFQIKVTNTNATTGQNIFLVSTLSSDTQYSSQTFLNSKFDIDENTSLQRVANSHEVDLVRGILTDFRKVNIQGRLDAQPSGEVTIGLGEVYDYVTSADARLQVLSTNDNQPAGTGARTLRVQGVLDTGAEFDSTYDVNTGIGTMGLNIVSVERLTIASAGSLHHNDGDIKVLGSSNEVLGIIKATENVSHNAYFRVPADKQLIVRDIQIAGYSAGGSVDVKELDSTTQIEASIGIFKINTNNQTITYTLDGLLTAGKVLKINYIPDAGITGDVLLNVNVNGVLCPTIASY